MPAPKDDAAFLKDMVDAADAVMRHVSGKTRRDYDNNEMLRDAVERRVEIFGEAARGLSHALIDAHPEIPWRKIMGTRHILAHEYGDIDPEIMWAIATQHIPQALPELRRLLPPAPHGPA